MNPLGEELERRIESPELARLTMVVFRRMHRMLRTSFLLELLVVHRVVLGFGGALRNQECSPSLLGHPMSGLELCRRGGSDYTRDCTRGDAKGVPNARI